MHHEEIELNFDVTFQQILGMESEILWESEITTTSASFASRSKFILEKKKNKIKVGQKKH
jgi:hypothetical protein